MRRIPFVLPARPTCAFTVTRNGLFISVSLKSKVLRSSDIKKDHIFQPESAVSSCVDLLQVGSASIADPPWTSSCLHFTYYSSAKLSYWFVKHERPQRAQKNEITVSRFSSLSVRRLNVDSVSLWLRISMNLWLYRTKTQYWVIRWNISLSLHKGYVQVTVL